MNHPARSAWRPSAVRSARPPCPQRAACTSSFVRQEASLFCGNPQSPQPFSKQCVVAVEINARSPLPMPWPYHVGNDTDLFGWAFAIMPQLPGTMGSSYLGDSRQQDQTRAGRCPWRVLTQLHQATFGAPGPYDAEREAFVATDDFRGWTLDGIESLRARCRAIDALRRKPSATSTS